MGNLDRHPIEAWRRSYHLEAMVETGTWQGRGIITALDAGYPYVRSIEAHEAQARQAERNVRAARPKATGWAIRFGDSARALSSMLNGLPQNPSSPVLFWLDAHLPERYGPEGAARLPLLRELRTIVHHPRDHSHDVLVVDDWRLYEAHPYGSGQFPGGPPGAAEADTIYGLLATTHKVRVSLRDEGYLVALPRIISS